MSAALMVGVLAIACRNEGAPGSDPAAPGPRGEEPLGQTAPATLRKLTTAEYLNTLVDLFGPELVLPTAVEPDPPDLASCSRPAEPVESYPDLGIQPQIGPRNQAMAELLAMALACDQTRVFSHFLTEPITNVHFGASTDGHHNRTHDEPNPQSEVNAVTIECVTHLASFLTALRAIPEGGGTLLDSCVVLGCSEVSYGRIHSVDEMPIVIAGSAGGALVQDVHYRSTTQENVSKVILTLQRAVGVVAGEWGTDAAHVTEGLSGIEV